jgi:glycosyltransferase involved in cell wall biosynthesis
LNEKINVRLAIQQRVLPAYRVPFFEALEHECTRGMHLLAGQARREEMIESQVLPTAPVFTRAANIHLFKGRLYLCWQKGFINWLQNSQPDVLIMEANPRYLSSYGAIRWMKRRKSKVIGWGLGSSPNTGNNASLRKEWRRRFLMNFDGLITYSQKGAEEYAQLGFARENIFVAPNAAVPRPMHAAPNRPNQFIGGRAVVLFVGRLQARKRVDYLIRACAAQLKNSQPLLWIVGDGPMRSELESLANDLYPQTRFFGAMHGAELDQQFTRADLFVLPGTGGLAIQQAMSFGLPVIVGQADGTQVDLVRPENGWSLVSGSLEALTQALELALADSNHLRSMGMESYRIVKDEANLENMVKAFILAVNSIAGKRP